MPHLAKTSESHFHHTTVNVIIEDKNLTLLLPPRKSFPQYINYLLVTYSIIKYSSGNRGTKSYTKNYEDI